MKKASYTDGFVIVIPKKAVPTYKKMAKLGAKVWKEYGAIDYKECFGDDLKVKFGLPFPKLAKVKSNEVIVFSWITYKSKAHRNQVNKAVMKDKRICDPDMKMPFTMRKFSYGGFKIVVS